MEAGGCCGNERGRLALRVVEVMTTCLTPASLKTAELQVHDGNFCQTGFFHLYSCC